MSKNEPFAPWQCPLCGEKLTGDSTLKCTKGHCFDRAKEGYWHLLPVQSMRTKAPGDSKEMVAARRAFLNAGYYGIFGKAVGELCAEYGQPASPEAALHLLDKTNNCRFLCRTDSFLTFSDWLQLFNCELWRRRNGNRNRSRSALYLSFRTA